MSAMYYLSRGGAPEGPFEEARLVYMIQSGELTRGGVCPVGHNQWLELNTVPAFAQALAARSAPAAPAGPGYRASPSYAAPAQAPGYSRAAQPQYAAHAQPYPEPGVPPPAKKSNRALLVTALVAGLALVLVGVAVGAYALFFSVGGARGIAQSMPQDAEFLSEVPSVHQLLSDLHDVQFLDTSLRNDQQMFDSASDSISKAFDISQSDAIALLASAETFGVSGRKLASTPEVVLALGMKSASSVETLLKSARFVASGTVGQTGRAYKLVQKPAPAGADRVLESLSQAQIGDNGKDSIVWFANAKLLALGSLPLLTDVARVIESGAASMEQKASYQSASKGLPSGARLRLFLDPALFATITEPKLRELVDAYFKPAGPLTGWLQVKPAGFLSSFTGQVTGSKLPGSAAYEAPQALDLGGRLPEETFAYLTFSAHGKLSGADAEKLLLDQLSTVSPSSRAEVEREVRQVEQLLGVSVAKLVDGAAGQSVLGLAMPATAGIAAGIGPQTLAQFNLTWVLELKDDSEYKKLAAGLATKILPTLREANVSRAGDGFTLTPRAIPLPISLRVQFLDKYLFVTAGANGLCDRAEAAFSKGDHTLKDDPAHKTALASLPATQQLLLWLDTGRIADMLLQNPLLHAQITQSGLSLDKVKLTGPERIVSALSLRSDVKEEVWTYQVDALNFEALAPLAAASAALGGSAVLGGALQRLPAL